MIRGIRVDILKQGLGSYTGIALKFKLQNKYNVKWSIGNFNGNYCFSYFIPHMKTSNNLIKYLPSITEEVLEY